ncbi:MAG: hypothetical protein P857_1014 [Candidatus Xenolissoclinum pacificiensis L6]|uniref:Uncharacterized protein n=1 Tax=Candidatus Xenolissoclinum pacificiensis L6 TaxID=1401685 RepID=W2V0A1_9RICK|nr:MAG: hypothetical protein P857_1014 [Candidatus Xenolissoclinum pacificiensis L6]
MVIINSNVNVISDDYQHKIQQQKLEQASIQFAEFFLYKIIEPVFSEVMNDTHPVYKDMLINELVKPIATQNKELAYSIVKNSIQQDI